MIVQKYHSLLDLDEEFTLPLEELLANDAPCLQALKKRELESPSAVHFVYFLFFGKQSNAPIAFARACLYTQKNQDKRWFFAKKEQVTKRVFWSLSLEDEPCPTSGICIAAGRETQTLEKWRTIIEDFDKRAEVREQRILVQAQYEQYLRKLFPKAQISAPVSQRTYLLKAHSSYERYTQELDKNTRASVKRLWQNLYANKDLRIGEYHAFKEAFTYKSQGSLQYQKLKKEEHLKFFIENSCRFLTLEGPTEVDCLIFIMQNSHGHMFFSHYSLQGSYDEDVITQVAIMHFYEKGEANKLSSLAPTKCKDKDQALGFHEQKLYSFETRK